MTAFDVVGSGRRFRVVGERAVYDDAYYTDERGGESVRCTRHVVIKGRNVNLIKRYLDPDTKVEYAK